MHLQSYILSIFCHFNLTSRVYEVRLSVERDESFAFNPLCLSLMDFFLGTDFISYLLHYVLTHTQIQGAYVTYLVLSIACTLVFLIGLGMSFITFKLLAVSYCWPISLQNNEFFILVFYNFFCRKNLPWNA